MSDDKPRHLDWQRFVGAFANAGTVPPSSSAVIGVAADVCPCCDERYVVVAAVHPEGFEVSVSLPPEAALNLAQQIVDAYRKVAPAPGQARQ